MSRAEVARLVERGRRFAVTCHRRPDPDALGSALGWAAVLRALGKEVVVYSVDPPPRSVAFLELAVGSMLPEGPFDACFVMDAAAATLFPPFPEDAGPIVVIDHHAAHDDAGDVICREPDACATGLVVIRLMRELGLEAIPPAAAPPLYAAIVADTGGFRYASTTPEVFREAAELLEAGAHPWTTARSLFEEWPEARFRLLARTIADLSVRDEGRVAVMVVPRRVLDETGATDEMVDGMVNYARRLQGVAVAILLWEVAPGTTKLSLRASGDIDVARVATSFGGGGHRAAAGATIARPLLEVVEPVVERVVEALRGEPLG